MVVSLGAVTALSGAACQSEGDDDGSGGEGDSTMPDDDDSVGYVSTYGVGPSSVSSSTGVQPICTAFTDDTDCGVCLGVSCCDQGEACEASAGCLELKACLSACSSDDIACAAGCQEENPEGYTLFQAVYQCAASECPDCTLF